jgi:hypothetical protein
MKHQPHGYFGDSRTMSFAVARFVQEGGVPSGREIWVGFEIAGLRGEEEGIGGYDDLTDPEIRVMELAACQVTVIISGIGAVRSRVRQDRVRGGIFRGKERIGEVVKGVRNAGGPCVRDGDNVAAVVG